MRYLTAHTQNILRTIQITNPTSSVNGGDGLESLLLNDDVRVCYACDVQHAMSSSLAAEVVRVLT